MESQQLLGMDNIASMWIHTVHTSEPALLTASWAATCEHVTRKTGHKGSSVKVLERRSLVGGHEEHDWKVGGRMEGIKKRKEPFSFFFF